MKYGLTTQHKKQLEQIIVTIKSTTYLTILLKNMYRRKLPELSNFGSYQKGMDKFLQVIFPLFYDGAILFMLHHIDVV